MIRSEHASFLALFSLISLTAFSGFILSSTTVSADNDSSVDDVSITVPAACTLSGTGMNSHTATIASGTYESDIGTTTLKAYCNDNEGFSIYAIGYTDNTDGKNVLTSSALGSDYDITTGTGTSGNSQWAMKLGTVTSPAPTYPISIQNNYNNYHTVPNDYDLVAKRIASTDTGEGADGSTLTTTYQVFVNGTQPAGTYNGQVKYVMVHPNYVDKNTLKSAVTVVYDGNGLTFPDGSTTNTVKYANVCQLEGDIYVGNNPSISKTTNIANDGVMNTYNTSNDVYTDTVSIPGADNLRIELTIGYDENGGMNVFNGVPEDDGDYEDDPTYYGYYWDDSWEDNNEQTSNINLTLEGDTVTFMTTRWGEPTVDYYGYYAKVYPIYYTEQPNTTAEQQYSDNCQITPVSGTYVETTTWNGKWTAMINGNEVEFEKGIHWYADANAEASVVRYIENNYSDLNGTTLTLYSHNPVTFDMVYSAANKTKLNGYYVIQDLNGLMCSEVTNDEITTVIDNRDNNTYEIIKLEDGNCWLRNNLRLNPTDPTTASNMSSLNTNASDGAIYNYLNGGNNNNVAGWTSTTVSDSWPEDNDTKYITPLIYSDATYLTNGINYNYCAATVGTYCYGWQNDHANIEPQYSLCPKGWGLPTSNSIAAISGHYQSLWLTGRGSFDGDSYSGELVYLWSSTFSNARGMITYTNTYYSLSPLGGSSSYSWRSNGNYIRCVLFSSE